MYVNHMKIYFETYSTPKLLKKNFYEIGSKKGIKLTKEYFKKIKIWNYK